LAYCFLFDFYLSEVKQESDSLCLVGNGAGADSDLQNRIGSGVKRNFWLHAMCTCTE